MSDLTVYIAVFLIIPGLLVLGIALREWIIDYYHRHHRGHHYPA